METSEVKRKIWVRILQIVVLFVFFGMIVLHCNEIISGHMIILLTSVLYIAYITALLLSWFLEWFNAPYRCECGEIHELKLIENSKEQSKIQQMGDPNFWKCPACKS